MNTPSKIDIVNNKSTNTTKPRKDVLPVTPKVASNTSTSSNKYKLTPKQKIMADTYLNSDRKISKTKAVQIAYPNVSNDVSAASMAYENFRKPQVQAYLRDHEVEAQQTIIEMQQQREDKRLAFDAARDIQDRIHGKAKQMVEVNSTAISLSIDLSGGVLSPSKALPE